MDSFLFFAPALAYEFISRHRNWKGVQTLFIGFLPFLLWELFSIFYYGFLFPNTAYAKLNTDIPKPILIQHGLTYFQNSLFLDPITLVTIVFAIGLSIFQTGAKERMLTAGVGLYLLYVLAIGGDFMSGRFFSAALIPSTIVLLQFLKRFNPRGKVALAGVILFMGLLPSFSSLWRPPSDLVDSDLASKAIDPLTGISDERLFYFSTNGLINMNWNAGEPDHIWAELGKEYRAQGTTVEVVTAAGMVGYFAGPNVHIVDSWALCDPLLARIKNDESNPRIGHFTRRPVEGYIETLQTGQNQISDSALARYYGKLKSVISGDLWSWERLKTIWEMNTGQYDDLLDSYSQNRE